MTAIHEYARAYFPLDFNPLKRRASGPLFVYLPIAALGLAARQRGLVSELNLAEVKPTDLTKLHVTLVFVQSCSDFTITKILETFRPPAKVGLEVTSVEVLEGGESPALVWIVNPDPGLVRLQSDLYYALLDQVEGMSEFSDPRVWKPHITIAYDLPTVPAYIPTTKPFKLSADRFVVGRDEFQEIATVRLDGGVSLSKGFVEKVYTNDLDESSLYTILRGERAVVGPLRRVLDLKDGPFSVRGGEGSGNFEHAGRPGEVGGSAPGESNGKLADGVGRYPEIFEPTEIWELAGSGWLLPDGRTFKVSDHGSSLARLASKLGIAMPLSSWSFYKDGIARLNASRGTSNTKPELAFSIGRPLTESQKTTILDWIASDEQGQVSVFFDAYLDEGTVEGQLEDLHKIGIIERGGEGSGNFDHAGRPGEVGGSASSDGGTATRQRFSTREYPAAYLRALPDAIKQVGEVVQPNDVKGHIWSLFLTPDGDLVRITGEHRDNAEKAALAVQASDLLTPKEKEDVEKESWMDAVMASGVHRLNIISLRYAVANRGVSYQADTSVTSAQWDTAQAIAIAIDLPFDEWNTDTYTNIGTGTSPKWQRIIGLTERGGEGSGHHGHAGRPGEQGGSQPGEGEAVSGGREVYHGATLVNAKRILASGIQLSKSQDGRVWAASYRDLARDYAMFASDRKPYGIVVIDHTKLPERLPGGESEARYGEQGKWSWDVDIPPEAVIRVEIWANKDQGESEPREIIFPKRSEGDESFVPILLDGDSPVGISMAGLIERGGEGSGNFDHAGRPGEVGGSAAGEGGGGRGPLGRNSLRPLAKLATHYKSFEAFESDYQLKNYHGLYWHLTDNPNFALNPGQIPRDASTMAGEGTGQPGLMVTTDISNWRETLGETRQYAALIDLGDLNPNVDYQNVARGFGHEIFVNKPDGARVISVHPIAKAERISDRNYSEVLPNSSEELRAVYDWAKANLTERGSKETIEQSEIIQRGGHGSGHFTHDGRPGSIGGSTPGEGGPASWNETAERASVLGPRIGKISTLKDGATREQAQRFYDRRNAVEAANRFKYRDGNSSREVIDAKLLEGPATIRRERFYYEIKNRESGQSMRFTRNEERDYIDVLMNHGRFTRNYDLIQRGGPGSGFHGHAGRPGEVGGSAPGTGEKPTARKLADAGEHGMARNKITIDWPRSMPNEPRRKMAYDAFDDGDPNDENRIANTFVLESNEEIKAVFSISREPDNDDEVFLYHLATQEKGWGRQAMAEIARQVFRMDVGLVVEATVQSADFYRHLGMRQDRRYDGLFFKWNKDEVSEARFLLTERAEPVEDENDEPDDGVFTTRGGPGSGFAGHAGRPGEVGGSQPGEGGGEIRGRLIKTAIETYGTTDDPKKAGYILPNGVMLDFSLGYGQKRLEHSDIGKIIFSAGLDPEEYPDTMHSFMKQTGAIRMVAYGDFKYDNSGLALEFVQGAPLPTQEQWATISGIPTQSVEIDVSRPSGGHERGFSISNPNGVDASDQRRYVVAQMEKGMTVKMILRHLGPGPHPSGSEQDVHGSGGGGTRENKGKGNGKAQTKEIYHGTGTRAAKSIMKTGLQVGYADSNNVVDGVVFAAPYYETARDFASRSSSKSYAIITIDPSLAGSKPERGPIGGEFMFDQDIPPDAIIKVDIYGRGETRGEDRLLETIERTAPGQKMFAAAAIDDNGDFTLIGPTLEDMIKRHLGPGPHPSGTEQDVHSGDGGGTKEGKGKKTNGAGAATAVSKRSPEARALASSRHAAAKELEPKLSDMMAQISTATGGELVGLDHAVKTEESLARKIDADTLEKGINADRAAEEISDANRYTIVFSSEEYTNGVLDAQQELEDRGYVRYDDKWKNYFTSGDAYDGYNSVYVNQETGDRFEVQFHTPETVGIKERAHELYERFQESPEGSPDRLSLWQEMGKLWSGYEKPVGWQSLPGVLVGSVSRSMPEEEAELPATNFRYFVRIQSNPDRADYQQSLSVHRLAVTEETIITERWEQSDNKWVDNPDLIAFTGIGGADDYREVDLVEAEGIVKMLSPDNKRGVAQNFEIVNDPRRKEELQEAQQVISEQDRNEGRNIVAKATDSLVAALRTFADVLTGRGGPGSGHFGHAGRKGEVGGSEPGEGGGAAAKEGRSYRGGRIVPLSDDERENLQTTRRLVKEDDRDPADSIQGTPGRFPIVDPETGEFAWLEGGSGPVLAHVEDQFRDSDIEHLTIIRPDGTLEFRLHGDENGVGTNMVERMAIKDAAVSGETIMTHNHPGVENTLSNTDLVSGIGFGFREIRATTSEGTYWMRFPDLALLKENAALVIDTANIALDTEMSVRGIDIGELHQHGVADASDDIIRSYVDAGHDAWTALAETYPDMVEYGFDPRKEE